MNLAYLEVLVFAVVRRGYLGLPNKTHKKTYLSTKGVDEAYNSFPLHIHFIANNLLNSCIFILNYYFY
jgi:hypothetical protein